MHIREIKKHLDISLKEAVIKYLPKSNPQEVITKVIEFVIEDMKTQSKLSDGD